MKEAQAELESGKWVIGRLAGLVHAQLSESFFVPGSSLTSLSLARYRGAPSGFNFSQYESGLDRDWRRSPVAIIQAINSAVREDFPGARLASFEKATATTIKGALSHISSVCSDLFCLIGKCQTVFLRIKKTNFRSASHPHLFGAILIGDKAIYQEASEVAVSIVHECAHQELFYLNLVDRLVNEGFEQNAVYAPFQNRLRPPLGRLHSLWALYRMIQFEKASGEVEPGLFDHLARNAASFKDGELTDFAKYLVSIAAREVA